MQSNTRTELKQKIHTIGEFLRRLDQALHAVRRKVRVLINKSRAL